jgi:hypothetical protein
MGVFCLTEIKRIVQLLQHDQLRSMSGTRFNAFSKVHQVHPNVCGIGLLD